MLDNPFKTLVLGLGTTVWICMIAYLLYLTIPTKPKLDIEIGSAYVGMSKEEWRALKGSQFEVFDSSDLSSMSNNAYLFEDDKLVNWTIKLDVKEVKESRRISTAGTY